MKLTSIAKLFGMMCVALGAASSAHAVTLVPISDLYNTGMSTPWTAGVQTPLPGSDPGIVGDPHWTVAKQTVPAPGVPLVPYNPSAATRTLDDTSFPFLTNAGNRHQRDLAADPNKVNSDLDSSQWIKQMANPLPSSDAAGVYLFETTFTTSMPLTSISISGFFKASNVLGIQLNGGALFDPGFHSGGSEPTPVVPARAFTITGTGGLVNTLRFYVDRPSVGVAALRVQFSNATFTVPEPSTIVLGALGLIGFGATRLRRRLCGVAQAK